MLNDGLELDALIQEKTSASAADPVVSTLTMAKRSAAENV